MIKYSYFILLVILAPLYTVAQPIIKNVQYPNPDDKIELFDKIELKFHINEYTNNYDSEIIRVDGKFISPSGKTYTVPGFYYVEYVKEKDFSCKQNVLCESLKKAKEQPYNWMIRFTPDETGRWEYVIIGKDKNGRSTFPEKKKGSFNCIKSNRTGFITKNNNRYLKKGDKPVFMVGTNIAWYGRDSYYDIPVKESGTNDYKRYIHLLAQNNANFMRLWVNHSAGISLIGREWTTGEMYSFDNYNQKDAWQLDQIISEADNNNINIVLSLLQQNAFVNSYGINNWKDNNAFNKTVRGSKNASLQNPFDIFSNKEAIHQTKNLFRYIIARWGYATNIISWELWNEVEQLEKIWQKANVPIPDNYYEIIIRWHDQMAEFMRKTDPFGHLVSTSSPNKYTDGGKLFPDIWYKMDLTVSHDYKSYKSIVRMKQFETHMLKAATNYIETPRLTDKPYMSQEWGFSTGKEMVKYDPNGYEFHCCLWSSSMSGAFGSMAPWWWDSYLLKKHLFKELQPVSFFMNSVVEHLNGSTKGYKVQIHGLTVFYATTEKEDIFIGWCQDDNYDFSVVKNTRYIKNLKSSKPRPAGRKSIIKLRVNKNKQTYTIRWYDTQNAEMVQEETVSSKGYKIKFTMPQDLRTSTFGDGAFIITTGKPTVRTEESSTGPASKHIKL